MTQHDTKARLLALVLAGTNSFAELRRLTGLSQSTVRSHLHRLKAQGFVTWDKGQARSIRALVDEMPETL